MTTKRDELDVMAGEYLLGLLSDMDRSLFEAALMHNEDARKALRSTRERFSELDTTAHVADVPHGLWARIEGELDKRPEAGPITAVSSGLRPTLGLKFWHGFTAAAVAAVALVAAGLGAFWMMYTPAQPQLIVVLLDAQAQPGAIVEAYASERVRVVPLTRFNIPEGKVLQVWTLPSPATGPVSLGLLEGARATTLTGIDLPSPQPEQLYEITLEQAGGSPTGRPTGPIVAKGFARAPQI